MKQAALVLILFTSCATLKEMTKEPSLYMETVYDKQVRQCSIPVEYFIDQGVSSAYEAVAHQGFEDWNNKIGIELFVFAGYVDYNPMFETNKGIVVKEEYTIPGQEDSIAWTRLSITATTGCINYAYINIHKISLFYGYDYSIALTTMHHEIGHTLGLDHSNLWSDIMYPTWRSKGVISEREIAEVKSVYYKH